MRIGSVNRIGYKPSFRENIQTQKPLSGMAPVSVPIKEDEDSQKENEGNGKTIALVSAAVVLAGLGVYAFRKELGLVKNLKKAVEENKPAPQRTSGGNPPSPPYHPNYTEAHQSVMTGFADDLADTGTNIGEQGLFRGYWAEDVRSVVDGNLSKKPNMEDYLKEIERIAGDFAADTKRIDAEEQASNLLEQAYLRKFVKTVGTKKSGIAGILERMEQEGNRLTEMYVKLPLQKVLDRLKMLKNVDLKAASYEKMTADEFFTKALSLVMEKKAPNFKPEPTRIKTPEGMFEWLAAVGENKRALRTIDDSFKKEIFVNEKITMEDIDKFCARMVGDKKLLEVHQKMDDNGRANRSWNISEEIKSRLADPKLDCYLHERFAFDARIAKIVLGEEKGTTALEGALTHGMERLLDFGVNTESILSTKGLLKDSYGSLSKKDAILAMDGFEKSLIKTVPKKADDIGAFFKKLAEELNTTV